MVSRQLRKEGQKDRYQPSDEKNQAILLLFTLYGEDPKVCSSGEFGVYELLVNS